MCYALRCCEEEKSRFVVDSSHEEVVKEENIKAKEEKCNHRAQHTRAHAGPNLTGKKCARRMGEWAWWCACVLWLHGQPGAI
jgi:hypothetical protein